MVIVSFKPWIVENHKPWIKPSARLLNQINKICEAES